MNISDLKKYDPAGMHHVYDKWPQIARESYESDFEESSYDGIDHIIFAGVGGSGAIGDLFSSILSKSKIHVSLVKGYLLPKTVDKNTLVITTSFSGYSQETITVLESAQNLECSLIAFSSGGKMEDICTRNKIDYKKIEMIHSPRTSFIKYVYSILKILNPILAITSNDIDESIDQLFNMRNMISSENLSKTNVSLDLAQWISGIPLIYYPHGLQSAAIRFKSSFQENTKSHIIIEDVIEASHNGIVAWENKSIIQPIMIRGQDDYIKTKERWDVLKKYFDENKIEFREIQSVKGHILTKLVSLIYMLDYTSIYKAVLNKTDPSPVKSIDYIKKNI
ncbi:MAG: SIS domain-containing protein [Nitrosopumilus sp.]|jgi:glucose/mannose-6-phosphate isomerase|nr:SIS domain-containing protein [Nitrosopumilus sp.]